MTNLEKGVSDMFDYYEFEAQEKRNDLMHEAAHTRLVNQATRCRAADTLSSRALIWAGNKLVASGKRMQTGTR
jgi:hypothetical protein